MGSLTDIQIFEIPWTATEASLSKIKTDTSAHIDPGKTVRVAVNLGAAGDAASEMPSGLQDALNARLVSNGLILRPSVRPFFCFA